MGFGHFKEVKRGLNRHHLPILDTSLYFKEMRYVEGKLGFTQKGA